MKKFIASIVIFVVFIILPVALLYYGSNMTFLDSVFTWGIVVVAAVICGFVLKLIDYLLS